jgi:hypothetical protein
MAAPKGTRPPAAGMGRKKGTPNKMTAALKDMILKALNEAGGDGGGVAYLTRQAEENPAAFMTLLCKVLPLQVAGDGGRPILITTGVHRAEDETSGG